MELFNGIWIHHMPEKIISGSDYLYLGMTNDYEYHLVVEDNELRIYSYDYWSEDNILSDYEGEDWYGYLHECFEGMYDCFARDTMRYMTLNIEGKETFDIAKGIVNWVDRNMTGDANWYLVENDDRRSASPSSALIKFIERALSKIGVRVYCYYK